MTPLHIAILAHSTNPRGGVSHALALGETLTAMGHRAVVHAPDSRGESFYRAAKCETRCLPASAVHGDLFELVEVRVGEYVRHFEQPQNRKFDIYHAQDGISGNALADLKQRGIIAAFARTIHHVEQFDDPRVDALQRRSIIAADKHFAVSKMWQTVLARDYGVAAAVVGNGVDRTVFSPQRDGHEEELRARFGVRKGEIVFLAVGGIEHRKNSNRLLHAFGLVQTKLPQVRLVIAGGASLLDHRPFQAEFKSILSSDAKLREAVVLTGPLKQADMPVLYRMADALTFPSIAEGFGLVVLEAIACGIPVVVSRISPFTEYLGLDEAEWCDPFQPDSITAAMLRVIEPQTRARLTGSTEGVLKMHEWTQTARAHLTTYNLMREFADA